MVLFDTGLADVPALGEADIESQPRSLPLRMNQTRAGPCWCWRRRSYECVCRNMSLDVRLNVYVFLYARLSEYAPERLSVPLCRRCLPST